MKSNGALKAIILVGGEGTRLRPLTYTTVKSMIQVLNRPFIEYVIRHLSSHNIGEAILALGYKPDSIMSYFGHGSELSAKLIYSVEQTPLGTAGAVKNAGKYVDDTFFVINGDIFTDLDLTDMFRFHKQMSAKVTIALTSVEDPTQFGVVETDNKQRINRFIEKPSRDQVTSHLINAGTYIIEPEVLNHIPEGGQFMFEHDLFPKLLAEGEPILGYISDSYWIDVGTPEKYLQLNHDLLCGKSSQVDSQAEDIHIDVRSSVHPQAKLIAPVLIDKDCTIDHEVCLRGPVVIGAGCNIGHGAIIESSILWQDVSVGEQAVLKNCIIASDSDIEVGVNIDGAVVNDKAPVNNASVTGSRTNIGG